MDFEQQLGNKNDSVPDDDEVHVVYLKPPVEKIHELAEFVKTLFSGVKNCEQTKGYIKIVFVDKMSKIITVDRHEVVIIFYLISRKKNEIIICNKYFDFTNFFSENTFSMARSH